ncbi:hypothetical protein IW261DRAFT_1501362 [Armillaria novae-zelandiae]|uniref:SLC26A/SulP transporter domain-containing protein n=1 Tax=Armillaria novae-zelandiae TaxID=153914 RepID=A0AA39TZA0_9AGAR|nr:hypothetical protein IW261DRAFT_1520830 [Armillaria novae-zelandiae]KAK0474090.1 hypothetical protein IW261DRAFT_1501077 [Armillaria novae-zelandiae]KAK0474102.1 hypothetical protein IW261DRAFT_1501362 [Armillaria novae-zelandiae]
MLFGLFFLSVVTFTRGAPTLLTGVLTGALGGFVSNISITIDPQVGYQVVFPEISGCSSTRTSLRSQAVALSDIPEKFDRKAQPR